jgi:hypothetical protein
MHSSSAPLLKKFHRLVHTALPEILHEREHVASHPARNAGISLLALIDNDVALVAYRTMTASLTTLTAVENRFVADYALDPILPFQRI